MRKISSPKAIALFASITTIITAINMIFCLFLYRMGGVIPQAFYIIMPMTFLLTNILAYRVLFHLLKFPQHQIRANTTEDFAFQIYLLYYLLFFNFFVHTNLIPALISKSFNRLLGAKFGKNSFSSGFILDPPYTEIGENTIIGFGAVLCSHAIEGENVSYEKIVIGNNVTIGLRAIIMPGVIIEDDAIVAAGALVTKNTYIKKNEIWAGVPAKKIQKNEIKTLNQTTNIAS